LRLEHDFLGERALPDDVPYGLQTLRAKENFDISFASTPSALLRAMLLVKKAAALAWADADPGRAEIHRAIARACDAVRDADFRVCFPIDALQGGAGTSTHMNVCEVVANFALKKMGCAYGDYEVIHPLRDVNRGQSTNDVYATALRVAAIEGTRGCAQSCAVLQAALQEKENAFAHIEKLGRTEWMDAVPVTLGAEFGGFAQAVARDRWRLYKVEERLRLVNLGGGAIGTLSRDPLHRAYRAAVLMHLRRLTGMGLAAEEAPLDITQNCDVFCEVSGFLKSAAVNRLKIAGDLRRMNSGPKGGLGEIRLAPLQMGSTIMPGKVNPVIPELVSQVALRVIANDAAITAAASLGEFELNAFMPLIAHTLLESIAILTAADQLFIERGILPLSACPDNCARHLAHAKPFDI
jgi:aspartate ammonia-lyase